MQISEEAEQAFREFVTEFSEQFTKNSKDEFSLDRAVIRRDDYIVVHAPPEEAMQFGLYAALLLLVPDYMRNSGYGDWKTYYDAEYFFFYPAHVVVDFGAAKVRWQQLNKREPATVPCDETGSQA